MLFGLLYTLSKGARKAAKSSMHRMLSDEADLPTDLNDEEHGDEEHDAGWQHDDALWVPVDLDEHEWAIVILFELTMSVMAAIGAAWLHKK